MLPSSRTLKVCIALAALLCVAAPDVTVAQTGAPQTAEPDTANPSADAPAKDAVGAVVGAWEISNADHDQICSVGLSGEKRPGGYKIDFNRPDCIAKFPPLKDVVAWNIADDTIKLIDAKGKIYYEFNEVEGGMYESLRVGQPLTFLQNAASAADLVRTVEQMTGDWGVVRGSGDPVCIITLINAPGAATGDLKLQVKPGCDKGIAAFVATAWQMDHNELLLKNNRAQIWRFGETNGIWQRLPEGPDALSLVKQ